MAGAEGVLARLRGVPARLRRGRIAQRLAARTLREARGALTSLVLGLARPRADRVAIATLNADEENATVTAVRIAQREPGVAIAFVSPDPELARTAVAEAARCLGAPVPAGISFVRDRYAPLLRAFAGSARTFTTHVMLPGIDRSGRRVHTHLTHGSGPKPDTTFRGPTTVLASITDAWVPAQLREYRLPARTPVVREMPRLEVMRRAAGDRTVFARMGLDPERPVLVWAPTYRAIERPGGEVRVSGTRFTPSPRSLSPSPRSLSLSSRSQSPSSRSLSLSKGAGSDRPAGSTTPLTVDALRDIAEAHGWTCVAKPHPRDADDLRDLGLPVFTNDDLRRCGVTPYELFGAADLLLTDYSSVFTERAELGLPYALWRPDLDEFASSYRGFRKPASMERGSESSVKTVCEAARIMSLMNDRPSRTCPPSKLCEAKEEY